MKGIDVSENNGVVDWGAVKAAGFEFAIIRIGYGKGHLDSQFYDNVNGALKADGVDAIITDAKIKIKVDSKAAAVVGQNSTPDICLGSVEVSGSLSAYFTDTSLRAKSLADAPMSLAIRLDVSREDVMSDYVTIILPAVKLSLPKINDGDTCLQTDIDFTAFPAVYGSVPATTLIIQDTLA